MNLKQNEGIGLSDAIIAIVILMIFTGVIVSVAYNIYLESHFIKRNEQSTSYIVEIFEYAQGLEYVDVNSTNLINYINNKYDIAKAISGIYSEETEKEASYTIFINVEEKNSYIKQVDVTVTYRLGGKDKIVSMSTLINK